MPCCALLRPRNTPSNGLLSLPREQDQRPDQRLLAQMATTNAVADALLKSRLSVMGNLTTVLTLLLGIEIVQLRAIGEVEASGVAVVAIVAASVAVGFTSVGLSCAIFFQMLAAKIKEGHAEGFIVARPKVSRLYAVPMLTLAFSCPCTVLSLACSVCMRHDNHWSALVAAAILGVALFFCLLAFVEYCQIQDDCKAHMGLFYLAHIDDETGEVINTELTAEGGDQILHPEIITHLHPDQR